MSFYNSTQDLLNGALNRAGELTDGTSPYVTKCLDYLNSLYFSVYAGGNEFDIELGVDWEWAKSNAVITLQSPIATGTVTVTNGSATVTFSTAPSASSVAGWHLKIDNKPEFFKVSAHTGGATTATLDGPYTDVSASGQTYKLIKLDYQLASGILRLVGPMNVYKIQDARGDDEGKIYQMKYNGFMRQYPMHNIQQQMPTAFSEVTRTAAGQPTVRMNAYVADGTQARAEYDYIPIPTPLSNSGSDIPAMPREFRVALEYGAAYFLMVDKNDDRAAAYYELTQRKLEAMVNAYRKEKNMTAKDRGRLIPRLDLYSRTRKLVRQENG